MTTRPGYIWSGTEWVSIGQEAVVAPVSYQASTPNTPSTGDIWIDSNDDVPGIDTSQFLRWRKTAVGGETSVSGTDDNGLTLQYTANYEQVYLNGVLLVRGQDYTATNGTSITGLTALAANDVVEVFGVVARVVGDVYTQAQADAKYLTQVAAANTYATKTPVVFSVYRASNINFSAGGLNPAPFDTKEYDSNNFYNTSTYRFTPTIAGYYQFNAKVMMSGGSVSRAFVALVKNGAEFYRGNDLTVAAGSEIGCFVSGLIYLNGSTDWVGVTAYANNSGTMVGNQILQYFNGFLVRAA